MVSEFEQQNFNCESMVLSTEPRQLLYYNMEVLSAENQKGTNNAQLRTRKELLP